MGIRMSRLSKRLRGNGFRCLKGTTPKGYVPVCVGVENEMKRYMVHRKSLREIEFGELLYRAAEEYGFRNQGVLRIPYEAKDFEELWIRRKPRRRRKRVLRVRDMPGN